MHVYIQICKYMCRDKFNKLLSLREVHSVLGASLYRQNCSQPKILSAETLSQSGSVVIVSRSQMSRNLVNLAELSFLQKALSWDWL